MMQNVLLTEDGKRTLAKRSQRAAVLAATAALHIVTIHVLADASRIRHSRLEISVIEAKVIPMERDRPSPPPPAPFMLHVIRPMAPPPEQIAFAAPSADAVPVTQAIDLRDTADMPAPIPAGAPMQVDSNSVVRPRPISGPSGVDRYPKASMRSKESGTVVMIICVSPNGQVDSVRIANSSGFPRLDRVALGMAAEYRFKPATLHGHPVAACADYRIIFKVT